MAGARITDDIRDRTHSEFKALRAVAPRVFERVATRARRWTGELRTTERATHARFIERRYCFGISTRPDQG